MSQLINDIHGLTRKPSLGAPPSTVASSASTTTGYSPAATALAKFFIKASESGQKFDPQKHQAMYEVELPDMPAGMVAEVVQGGYAIGDRVLRPAMVAISKGGPKAAPSDKAD